MIEALDEGRGGNNAEELEGLLQDVDKKGNGFRITYSS
jgi:hypothetical protein